MSCRSLQDMRKLTSFAVCLLAALGCGNDSGGPAAITVDEPVVPAGESGEIVVTLRRGGDGGGAVSVPFSTRDGSAIAGPDFNAATGTVQWADGDVEDKTVVVTLVDDVVIEEAEAMVIELGKPSNGVIDKTTLNIAITDDDHPGDSFAVSSAGKLYHFDRAEPGRLTWSVDLSGLAANETVLDLDMRPADGKLYALTSTAKLYTIDPMTGAATLKSTLVADAGDSTNQFTALSGSEFGIDFNPVVDRLRLTSNTGQNLRINVDTGAVTTDTAINGLSSGYTAIAHNNAISAACRTTLYAIDPVSNRFLNQSSNEGTATGVGGLGLDATASGGFDVYTDADGKSTALAVLTVSGQSGMYAIDLGSGEATATRALVSPLPAGETVKSFALSTLPATTAATQLPGELYGVTATELISFNRAAPEKLCTKKTLSGLAANEVILDLDMRPSTGILYVLTSINGAGKLHRVDPAAGSLSPAINISVALSGTEFGMDFDPTSTVPLRIVSNNGQNLRVNDLTTGAATAGTTLNGAGTAATSAAHTDSVQGAGTSTLYVIDPATDLLRIQTPNTGTLVDVGSLGVDVTSVAGFDIDGRDNVAFVVVNEGQSAKLHTINLVSGALSASLGTIAVGPLRGVTRVTPQTNLYGVTTDGKLVRISMTDPSLVTVISDPMLMTPTDKITGLNGGEYLVGVDFRPTGGVMYGITNQGAVYSVNSSTASANKQGSLAPDPMDTTTPFSSLSGTSFDIDFEPIGASPLRVVSNTQQNLRVPNVSTPKVFTDTVLNTANITAAAYTNSFVGATSTMFYAIDSQAGQLMSSASPTSGSLASVGICGATGTWVGLDIAGGNNGIVVAALQKPGEMITHLYRLDLATGAATEIGTGIGGASVRSIAVQIR